MKALVINCTLKPSPEPSNTHALAQVVGDELAAQGVEVEWFSASPTSVGRPSSVTQRVVERTGRTMAKNLFRTAKALAADDESAPEL